MFKEIAYWTHYFCSKNKFLQKDRTVTLTALMYAALPEFINVMTIIYLIGYFIDFDILGLIPLQGRYSPVSYCIAFIETIPFLIVNYKCYFQPIKLKPIIEKYARMSKRRRIAGKLFYLFYWIFTWYFVYATTTYLKIR